MNLDNTAPIDNPAPQPKSFQSTEPDPAVSEVGKRKRPALPCGHLPSEDGETSTSTLQSKTKKRKKANTAQAARPINVRKLAKEKVMKAVMGEDVPEILVHQLGPDVLAAVVTWPYLITLPTPYIDKGDWNSRWPTYHG